MKTISSPGKFEGQLAVAPALYDYAMCGVDDECGDIDSFGFYAWRINGIEAKDFCPVARENHGLTDEDCQEASKWYGAILIEDSQGFVSLYPFKTKRVMDGHWKVLIKRTTEEVES